MFFDLIFIFQALEMQLQNPCNKKQHCHLHYADVLVERGLRRVQSFCLHKKWNTFYKWISSSHVFYQCYVFAAGIDLAKIMKRMLIEFLQSWNILSKQVCTLHSWKNGCSRVINGSSNRSLKKKAKFSFFIWCHEKDFDFFFLWQNLVWQDVSSLRLSSKAGLEVFVAGFSITFFL